MLMVLQSWLGLSMAYIFSTFGLHTQHICISPMRTQLGCQAKQNPVESQLRNLSSHVT